MMKEGEEEGNTENIAPKRLLKDEKTPADKKKQARNLKIGEVIFLLFIAVVVVAYALNYYQQNNPEPQPPIPELKPADVQLYRFLDLFGTVNITAKKNQGNIELWLINIGEEPATNISVYVRVRNNNGTLLFNRTIRMTTTLLRPNETCTGDYSLLFTQSKPIHLYTTLEISWDGGRNTYLKESNIT